MVIYRTCRYDKLPAVIRDNIDGLICWHPLCSYATMHQVIRVVVENHRDAEQAVEYAVRYFNENLHHSTGGPFDYCTPMNEDSTVSGSSRFTQYEDEPPAFPVDSERGRDEIHDAWDSTVRQMEVNLEDVFDDAREIIESGGDVSDFRDSILEDEMTQYRLSLVAGRRSTDRFLFMDGWGRGTGITTDGGWNRIERMIKTEQENDEDSRWVVPLDVHY